MRYLLDTPILSEPMRARPRERVLEALDSHAGALATASIVIHELEYGIARLPAGKRRRELGDYLEVLIGSDLEILPYTTVAARWHGAKRAELENMGRKPPFADGQIAAIAAVHELTLVTPNRRDFEPFAIPLTEW